MSNKVCPICFKEFECKVNHIEDCFCYSIQLSQETKELLSSKGKDCLCENCLLKIKNEIKSPHSFY